MFYIACNIKKVITGGVILNEPKDLQNLDSSYNNFELYDHLTVCSNQLQATTHVLQTADGWTPFSIRKGIQPRVWLSAPVELDSNNRPVKYIDLIINSATLHNDVNLISSEHGFQIKINDTIVMEAGNHDGNNLEIVKLDLSPIGLAQIKGDVNGLLIGGMTMSRNATSGANLFIRI